MNASQRIAKYAAMAFAAFLSITILYGILSAGIGILGSIVGENSVTNFDETFTDVKELNIDNGTGKLLIKSGDQFRVVGENVDGEFSARLKHGVLEIDNENDVRGLFRSADKKQRCVLTVYVPQSYLLNRAEIDIGLGTTEIEDLQADELILNMGAGNLTVDRAKATRLELDGGVGIARLKNITFESADLNGGVGEIKLDPAMGKRDDFAIAVDDGLGVVKINGSRVNNDYSQQGGQSKKLEIDGGVGSISIQFSETD